MGVSEHGPMRQGGAISSASLEHLLCARWFVEVFTGRLQGRCWPPLHGWDSEQLRDASKVHIRSGGSGRCSEV